MKKDIIILLEKEQEKIKECSNEDELNPIATAIISILQRCKYADDSAHINSLNRFYNRKTIEAPAFGLSSLANSKSSLSNLILNVINDIKAFGFPVPSTVKETSRNIIIHNTNSQAQSQQQTTSVDIVIEALRSELSDEQINELKDLYKKGESKGNILKKIAGWGVNTASVIGNILTNPKFWELLDKIPH